MAAPTEEAETAEFVPKKRTNGSIIWRYFGFKASDEEQKEVFCRECKKLVPSKASSTTNLFNHLQYNHKLQYEECVKLRFAGKPTTTITSRKTQQTTLQTSLPRCLPYDKTSPRWVSITESIAFHIAKDMTPIAVVEQPGFVRMVKTLDPRYNLPSRNFFAREELPRMYTRERARLTADLANVVHYALTTDMWSSRTCEPYMCVTIHYIDDEWNIKSACLQTTYFPQDHTGANIAEALGDVTTTWMSNPNPVAITTDNGSNVVSAAQIKKWLRMQCFGHRLHLAIGE